MNRITVIVGNGAEYELTQFGRQYGESSELIMREDRSASGKLRRDIVAEKKTFTLTYNAIDNAELILLERLLTTHGGEELTIRIERNNEEGAVRTDVYSVFMRPFSRQRMARGLWQGVQVEFIQS